MRKRSLALRLSLLGNSRTVRRFAVLLWVVVLCLDPWIVLRLVHTFTQLNLQPELLLLTATQLLLTWFAFRGMRTGLAQPTLEDSAMTHFGEHFEVLTEAQCEQLYSVRLREFLAGRASHDEREEELQRNAERAAYRLLRPGLTVAVAAYWLICFLPIAAAFREPLAVGAIVFTWFAVGVIVLPTMVRMWMQPNQVGEMQIVRES